MTWHYQWIVVNEFLARTVGAHVIRQALEEMPFRFPEDGNAFMPVEFSVAAYRFGHSQVRPGYLLAPIVRDRKGEYRKEFQELQKKGFQRVKVNGEFHDLDTPPELDKKYRHNIDVVVDRIVVREGLETRLADSLRTALDLADGIAILETEIGRAHV